MSKYKREDILQAGIDILTVKGFSGLGVQNVLKACGIPKGSFYNFFESKDTFVIEALSMYNEGVRSLLTHIDGNSALNQLEKIYAYYSAANDFFYNKGNLRTCPMMNTISDDVENKAIVQLVRTSMDMHKSFIAKWIKAASANGLIQTQTDPIKLTHMIYDNYHGVVLRMKYENSRQPLENFMDHVLPLYLK